VASFFFFGGGIIQGPFKHLFRTYSSDVLPRDVRVMFVASYKHR